MASQGNADPCNLTFIIPVQITNCSEVFFAQGVVNEEE